MTRQRQLLEVLWCRAYHCSYPATALHILYGNNDNLKKHFACVVAENSLTGYSGNRLAYGSDQEEALDNLAELLETLSLKGERL